MDVKKVLLPHLHIKLSQIKNKLTAIDLNCTVFQHLCTKFPTNSSDNLKQDIFGAQFLEVSKDKEVEKILTPEKLRSWEAFKSVCNGFLANIRALDY